MYLRFTITMISFPLEKHGKGASAFCFCLFYPSSPQPTRQCLAPTCSLYS